MGLREYHSELVMTNIANKKPATAPAKVGRPSKFTEDTRKRILEAIELGSTYELAAAYGGISYATLNDWLKREDEEYLKFSEDVKQAEGKAAIGWLTKIEKAATDGNWQAAAWKLERRYPREFGRTVKEVSGTLNVRDLSKLSDDELRAIAES